MSKLKYEIKLSENISTQEDNIVNELKNLIDKQLIVLQDRVQQEFLIDLDDVKAVLKDTEGIIDECYSTPNFLTNKYKNFSVLLFEYQRLAIKFEATAVEDKIRKLDEKTLSIDEKIKSYEGDLKNHLGTLVGLFLTFTLIPTAITSMSAINGNYILPVVSTLILFGILMITFIYTINHTKISGEAKITITIIVLLTVVLWFFACSSKLDISVKVPHDNEINMNLNS